MTRAWFLHASSPLLRRLGIYCDFCGRLARTERHGNRWSARRYGCRWCNERIRENWVRLHAALAQTARYQRLRKEGDR